MCIGIPMQVTESSESWAVCESEGQRHHVDMLLVGQQPLGTWVLVFLGAARELLSETQARQVLDALQALDAAQRGASIDHLFADLVGREPQLPDFLRPISIPSPASGEG